VDSVKQLTKTWHERFFMEALGRLEQELDLDCFEWEDDATAISSIENARIQESSDIGVNGLYIAFDTASSLSNRDRPGTAKDFQKLPALRRENLPKQFWRCEPNSRGPLGFPSLPGLNKVRHR
jgi:hypothetical protein